MSETVYSDFGFIVKKKSPTQFDIYLDPVDDRKSYLKVDSVGSLTKAIKVINYLMERDVPEELKVMYYHEVAKIKKA